MTSVTGGRERARSPAGTPRRRMLANEVGAAPAGSEL